ncbi:MAG: PSD1 and planctomycete cytochrome C domain-containing protein [Pirellulales bacterium]
MSQSWLLAEDPGDAGLTFFETEVRPVLVDKCYACHSQRAGKQEGGLSLDRSDAWLQGGDRGPAVIPGDPGASLVLQAVRYIDPDLQMPPTAKLTDDSIATLEKWIRLGAPAPTGDTTQGLVLPSDPETGKSHWAYQPLRTATTPAVRHHDWPRSTIDRWVAASWDEKGLHPVADTNHQALLRRLSFQLVGLPPRASHLTSYQSSPTPQTLARIVDELLASPQFGERWGRHWLDLARYADSNGLDENFLFREAWRYRNWVIEAVNQDLPFDRFLTEQLAGDLLPYDDLVQRDRQRIASGFLVVGPKVLLGVNPDRQRLDVADEQLDTIGRVVLGQTLGCARCHDHKFDPVPTADYYALAGILTSTQVMEQRFMLNEQRVMERLVGLGETGESLDDQYEAYWRDLANGKTRAERAAAALEVLQKKDETAIAAKLMADADSFAEGAKDPNLPVADRIAAQESLLSKLKEAIAHPPSIPPRAMVSADRDQVADESIRLAGKFDAPGAAVPRGFLQVLCDSPPAPLPSGHSGRLELAQWLTDPQTRVGALTARVQVNRIWQQLMGRGLVRTVDNWGRTGETPSHPELLDYLAQRFIDSGWSRKAIIREIVLSRTFALSSQHDETNAERDGDNAWLWRAHRRRLDPESLRDAMLSAAGQLDLSATDSTVSYLGDQATAVGQNLVRRRTDWNFRSVYLPVIRNDLPEIFEAFDFANPHFATGARPQTTVPTQGLFMLNDMQVMSTAEMIAGKLIAATPAGSSEDRIQQLFGVLCQDKADEQEMRTLGDYVARTEAQLRSAGEDQAELKAWALVCHAVIASSRFQYLE